MGSRLTNERPNKVREVRLEEKGTGGLKAERPYRFAGY